MVEDKQMTNQELEAKKLEKPVEKEPVEKVEATTPKSHKNISNSKTENNETTKASDSSPGTQKKEDTKKSEKVAEGDEKETGKKEEKPAEPVVKGKMKEAVVNGQDLRISTKHSIAICNFIRGKDIDVAVKELGEVENMKRAIPMRGEIPHRKGMMSGRYPVKAAGEFIRLLKSLKANAIYHDLELEKYKIACIPNIAARPQKRFGQARFKRTHVQLKLIPITKVKKNKNKKVGGKK